MNFFPSAWDPRRAVLNALLEGETYGLELRERVRRQCDVDLGVSLYPIARGLVADGLATVREGAPDEIPERMGRPRLYYSITDLGRALIA